MDNLNISRLVIFFVWLILLGACQKNQPPTCSINEPEEGAVFTVGDSIFLRVEAEDTDGVVSEVRLFINEVGLGELLFPFRYELQTDNMEPGSYQIRITVWDNEGLEASDELGITLRAAKSSISTLEASAVSFHSAFLGGRISNTGGGEISETGIYWDTIPECQEEGERILMAAYEETFADTVRKLPMGSPIFFRAFAMNEAGESLGEELQFVTTTIPSVITKEQVDFPNSRSARLMGELSDDGGEAVLEVGFYWGDEPSTEIMGNRMVAEVMNPLFTYTIEELSADSTYYFRAFALNAAGEAFGQEHQFKLPGGLEITTGEVKKLYFKKATVLGEVRIAGDGIVTERGVYWGVSPDPEQTGTKVIEGNGEGQFSLTLSDMFPGTTYYYKAYGETGSDIYFGQTRTVSTAAADTSSFIDPRDDQVYVAVTLGEQVWMGENLRATRLTDGTEIEEVKDSIVWFDTPSPAYCWYNNDEESYGMYGGFYNWYTVESGKLCPTGWHVPSEEDWNELEIFLGMDSAKVDDLGGREASIGGLLKSTMGWDDPNKGATNETLMDVLPMGKAAYEFLDFGQVAYFWTADLFEEEESWCRILRYNNDALSRWHDWRVFGMNVRCVKDK